MRSKLLLVVVALISLLAGIAVTGIPEDVPDDVVSSEISAPDPASTTTPVARTSSTTSPTSASSTTSTLSPVTSSTVGPAGATPTTLAAESSLRVVVVNAGGPPGIAARTAVDLRSGGYASVVTTDAVRAQTSSLVAFAPGFEAEARRLAAALEMSPGQVTPRATAQMPANDGPADLVVLLGTDRG